MNPGEFPHSEIPGSMLICSSPRLIAAYHVFHRLPVPRHSPCALVRLTFKLISLEIGLYILLILSCQRRLCYPSLEIVIFLSKRTYYNLCFAVIIQFSRYDLVMFRQDPACTGILPFITWWAKMDSNHRPHDYQSCALAS